MSSPPLDPEYHIARLLLLIHSIAARSDALDGLTKLAKLDFLIRYPIFLRQFVELDGIELDEETRLSLEDGQPVEDRMIRYKYGPWDEAYYTLIGGLVSRGLVREVPGRGRVALQPTELGTGLARRLAAEPAWAPVALRCELVAENYDLSGNVLKERIYAELPSVVDRAHRSEIT